MIYVSGVIALLEGEGTYEERYERGIHTALGRIKEIMEHAGGSMDDVVEMTSFHMDLAYQVQTLWCVDGCRHDRPCHSRRGDRNHSNRQNSRELTGLALTGSDFF